MAEYRSSTAAMLAPPDHSGRHPIRSQPQRFTMRPISCTRGSGREDRTGTDAQAFSWQTSSNGFPFWTGGITMFNVTSATDGLSTARQFPTRLAACALAAFVASAGPAFARGPYDGS